MLRLERLVGEQPLVGAVCAFGSGSWAYAGSPNDLAGRKIYVLTAEADNRSRGSLDRRPTVLESREARFLMLTRALRPAPIGIESAAIELPLRNAISPDLRDNRLLSENPARLPEFENDLVGLVPNRRIEYRQQV